MEITQVIVAYRNPFEMWLWESGTIYFLFAGLAISFVAIIISYFVNFNRSYFKNKR